jgi:hypothetical protein
LKKVDGGDDFWKIVGIRLLALSCIKAPRSLGATMRVCGIDLGTTNSLIALFHDGAPRLIPNALGDVLTHQ